MIKLGFIGIGGNNLGHLRRLKDLEDARIVAVCDVIEERAQKGAEEFSASPYLDFRTMLDKEELDAVYVSVPCDAHGDIELAVIEKGCHMFVEKPVTMDVEEGLQIAEAAEAAGIITGSGYQLRYMHNADRMSTYLHGKDIGLVNVVRWGGVPGTDWWRVMHRSGGQLHEQTTHQVDMLRYLGGEIVSVTANYARRIMVDLDNFTVPDLQVVLFEMESGALATLSTSCIAGQAGKSALEFLLRDQRIEFEFSGPIKTVPEQVPELDGASEDRPSIDWHFIEAIKTNNQALVRSSYRDALISASIGLAANESAVSGKSVSPYFA